MSRSSKKGPYIDQKLQKKIEAATRDNDRRVIRTWARASTIFSGDGWTHGGDPQWKSSRTHLRYRKHGGPPARRIRADPNVSRSWKRC